MIKVQYYLDGYSNEQIPDSFKAERSIYGYLPALPPIGTAIFFADCDDVYTIMAIDLVVNELNEFQHYNLVIRPT